MTSKVIEGQKSSSSFSVNPILPLLDGPLILPSPNCVDIFLSLSISFFFPLSFSYSLSTSLICSMQTLIYIIKGHMRPLLCRVIFNNFRSFDQITIFTCVLMDNFCPCFILIYFLFTRCRNICYLSIIYLFCFNLLLFTRCRTICYRCKLKLSSFYFLLFTRCRTIYYLCKLKIS